MSCVARSEAWMWDPGFAKGYAGQAPLNFGFLMKISYRVIMLFPVLSLYYCQAMQRVNVALAIGAYVFVLLSKELNK